MQPDHSFHTAIHTLALLDIQDAEQLSSEKIARSINTNPVVVRRMFGQLKAHGLVKVKAGKGGGYFLARPAGAINLWEIYLAIRKENVFRSRQPREHDAVSEFLPSALEDAFAKAEYGMKSTLSAISLRQVSTAVKERARSKGG
jgi:Rrf2 family protein